MSETFSRTDLFQNSFKGAVRMAAPSLPLLLLFALASGCLAWSANILPDDSSGTLVFALIAFGVLYAHCMFSVAMYRVLLPTKSGLFMSAWKLSLAWLLLITVTAIILSMLVLFFALIPTALGVVMQQGVEPITADAFAEVSPRELLGPVFWPTFILFLLSLLGLFWFASRMMLFAAATSSEGTIHVFKTWPWTKGLFRITGPALLLLIAIPVAISTWVAYAITNAIFGADQNAIHAGLSGMLTMIILAPSAWLGHSLAANVLLKVRPKNTGTETDPIPSE